jgi:hypothetical protein
LKYGMGARILIRLAVTTSYFCSCIHCCISTDDFIAFWYCI